MVNCRGFRAMEEEEGWAENEGEEEHWSYNVLEGMVRNLNFFYIACG